MSFIELFILAVGLSMDAFAVSVCKGLAVQRVTLRECSLAGVWFGGFQALMPTIGYFLGRYFTRYIESLDHWVAFILLAVATSIDALAVGITFAFLNVNILAAASFIGITTFVCSAAGVRIGSVFGTIYKSKAEFCGGVILVLIGLKILLEHMGVFG